MALLNCSVYSKELKMQTSLTVFLPTDTNAIPLSQQKTLYLLHGLTDGCHSWLTQTSICRYAQNNNIAVIMPEGHRSFYNNIPYSSNYFSYITEELPSLCNKLFQINTLSENTFIAGNSMGGYGALKSFFTYPEHYKGGCFAFSPVVKISEAVHQHPKDELDFNIKSLFGSMNQKSESENLYLLSSKMHVQHSKLYITCGTEDFLFDQNLAFHHYLTKNNISHYFSDKIGTHSWAFWEDSLKIALNEWTK
jgi:S-formylglutathione hydrolase FrmB